MQKWTVIDEKYLDELRKVDTRIPFSNYGNDRYKPFFGTLFEKDDLVYVVAISHAQEKHKVMKNNVDFIKIYINDDIGEGELVAVVNLRYMFPVPKNIIKDLKYSEIEQHRTFANEKEKSLYIDLMKKELESINKLNIENKAQRLYKIKTMYYDSPIAKRCLEYLKLEAAAKTFTDNK